jgi:hypothetical protein
MNAPIVDAEQAFAPEFTQNPARGLPVDSGHIGDFLVGERHLQVYFLAAPESVARSQMQDQLGDSRMRIVDDKIDQHIGQYAQSGTHDAPAQACCVRVSVKIVIKRRFRKRCHL